MMKSLHFSVTGKLITDVLRDLIRQNKYTKAFEIVNAGIPENISESDRMKTLLSLLLGYGELKDTAKDRICFSDEGSEKTLCCLIQELLTHFDEMAALLKEKEKQIDQLTLRRDYLLCCFQEDYPFSLKEYMNKFKEEWEEPFLSRKEAQDRRMENILYPDEPASGLSLELSEYIERMSSDKDIDNDYGWLSPTGVFYPVPWGEHNSWAYEWLQSHFGYTDLCTTKETDILCQKGWCLLHNPAMGIAMPTMLCPLTEKQKNFLYDYYTKRNKPELIREYCMI